jgi:hypothetical protein
MPQNKSIVVIRTPIFAKAFTQVTCLMSDGELEEAKSERPDLTFEKLIPELDTSVATEVIESQLDKEMEDVNIGPGITVRGMVQPFDIEEQAAKLLNIPFDKKDLLR